MKNCELVNYYSKILEGKGRKHTYSYYFITSRKRDSYELGMALALNKKIFLCSETKAEFSIKNTVNFYQLPNIVRLVGTADENLKEIIRL